MLCWIGTVRAADEPAAIIEKAIKAHGGEEAIAKDKAEQWKATGTIHMFDMKLPYSSDYFFESPDLFRFDASVEFGGQKMTVSAGTDGKITWEKAAGMVQDMPKKKAGYFLHNLYITSLTRLLPLRSKDFTLSLADEIKIGDKPAIGVKVSKKGHPDVTLWFDKESGLLVKSQTQVWDEFTDKDVSQEVFLSDYQKKDGRLYYHKLVIKRDGKMFLEEELSDQKTSEKLDPKLFAKP